MKREGRGGVTAHKSASPTLGPHCGGAPAPRGIEGHSATPGRPLSSLGASAPPWAQAALGPAPGPDRKPPAGFGGKPPLDAARIRPRGSLFIACKRKGNQTALARRTHAPTLPTCPLGRARREARSRLGSLPPHTPSPAAPLPGKTG